MSNALEQVIGQAIELFQQGNFAKSELKLSNMLKIYPNNLHVLNIYAIVLATQSKHKESAAIFKKALRFDPQNASLHYNLAKALQEVGADRESLPHHKKAIELNPSNIEALLNYGKTLSNLGELNEALNTFLSILQLTPDSPEALLNIGVTLTELARYEEALIAYNEAIALNPEYHEAWSDRGDTLAKLRRYEEALASYDNALEIKPDYSIALLNKGITCSELHRYEEALSLCNIAIKADPDYHEAKFNRGIIELSLFRFSTGWPDYEHRWELKTLVSDPLASSKKKWLGDKKANKLLVWAEQGIGDQILFGSILDDLRRLPQQKIIALDRRLLKIFARSFPEYLFLDRDQHISEDQYDEHISFGSLGQYFRNTLADFQLPPNPYLLADNLITQDIQALLKRISKNKKCGLSWKSTNPKLGDDKSIPLIDLLPILSNKNWDFINLQYGEIQDEIDAFQSISGREIFTAPDIDLKNDMDSLFAMINACDLIITTSNSTAHIAGALGKEVLLLLPFSVGKFWYWQEINGNSLFYRTVKIFQQKIQGDWSYPVKEIRNYLDDLTLNNNS